MASSSGFWRYVNERYAIYERRNAGVPPPWTRDYILQTYKFCDVFRQHDRQTVELLRAVPPLAATDPVRTFRLICLFRLFNWAPTFHALLPLVNAAGELDIRRARAELKRLRRAKVKLFTAAYRTAFPTGHSADRIDYAVRLAAAHQKYAPVAVAAMGARRLEVLCHALVKMPGVGMFIAYELACDAAYYPALLCAPEDALTWANAGPGAIRGCNRVFRGDKAAFAPKERYLKEMERLLAQAPKRFKGPAMVLRDIEHSLCEYDKYERVRAGEGRPRSNFRPNPEGLPHVHG